MKVVRPPLGEAHLPIALVAILIALLGIYNLHSSAAAHDPGLYVTQLAVLGLACLVALAFLFFDYRFSEGFAYPVYVVAVLLLVAVEVQGHMALGAQRWLHIGPLRFQPSEPAKLATILCLARYFSNRIEPGGYTMRTLFRPLNPSRPLVAILALAVAWKNPWLGDPLGQLARAIRQNLDEGIPEPGELLWFRVFLILLLLTAFVFGVWLTLAAERERALLDPWPPGQRRRIIILWALLCLVLGLVLATQWHNPFVRDPFGYAIARLAQAAGPEGAYAVFHSRLAFRLTLAVLATIYLFASVVSLRRITATMVDILIAPIDLLVIPAGLILVEPDLGTAGIVILIGASMILVVGVRWRTLALLTFLGICLSIIGWFGILKDYQKRRILTFIDPEHDLKGAGWNAVQSMIAVGSGRWTGKGHLEGTQTQLSFLPEQHTDFAFSVWSEEQGFLGCLLLIALYMALIAMAWAVAADARDSYGALLVTGVTAMIAWQALINMSMVSGIFPVVGVTLPLFSYGGSSLLSVMVGCGLILSVHLYRRAH